MASDVMTSGGARSVLVIGESLVDVVARPEGTAEHPGGSPMNVSVGVGRLGMGVLFLTRIGDDPRGALIRDHLQQAGVDLVTTPAGHTSVARATIDAGGSARYTFDLDWELPALPSPLPGVEIVHFGSIGAYVEPGAGVVRAIVAAHRDQATVTFDPNVRPQLQPDSGLARTQVEEHVRLSDMVKASDEDLAFLYPGRATADIARAWLDSGPALVVVTGGADGAVAYTARHSVTVPAHRVRVVDTIGAGDAFMAGLIRALADEELLGAARRPALRAIDEDALRRVLRVAVGTAALTVARAGAEPPTRAELTAFLYAQEAAG